MSPNVCRSKHAYAVAGSCRLASIQLTQDALGNPVTLPTTLFQVLPASRVSCTLPSSVPTQIVFGSLGDSAIEKMVVCISADELSTVTPPDCSCFCLSGSLVVRSGEMRSQLSPRSRDRNRNCAPM